MITWNLKFGVKVTLEGNRPIVAGDSVMVSLVEESIEGATDLNGVPKYGYFTPREFDGFMGSKEMEIWDPKRVGEVPDYPPLNFPRDVDF